MNRETVDHGIVKNTKNESTIQKLSVCVFPMSKLFRMVALIFFIAPLAAMFSEPFFEALFDRLEWDTENFAGPAMTGILQFASSPAVFIYGPWAICFGAGVWLHWLANQFDQSKSIAFKKMSPFLEEVHASISIMVSEHMIRPKSKIFYWGDSNLGFANSAFSQLRKLGIYAPRIDDFADLEPMSSAKNVKTYFSIIAPLSGTGDLVEAKRLAASYQHLFEPKQNMDEAFSRDIAQKIVE